MTNTDRKAFDTAFNRLAKAGLIHDTDVVAKGVYFDALADLPLWAVERAALQLQRTPVKFFTCAVWHQFSATALLEQRRRDTVTLAGQKMLPQQCSQCRDTGMRPVNADDPESRLTPCECRETNANYQQARARQRLADDVEETPTIPADETQRILGGLHQRDFKRIGSGE